MGTFPRIAIVALLQMAFIATAYGTRFFSLHLPVCVNRRLAAPIPWRFW